jgi:ABC transport system ATP-binding/permease protein
MAPPLLFLDDVHLSFGGTPLLEGVDLSVSAGDRLCLVGRNGSGKSTLLKIAAGLVEPDTGEHFLQPGVTLRYLPQEPDFTGFETVLAYVEAGLAPGDDTHRASYLLEQLGLTGGENPTHLSAARRGEPRWPGRWRRSPISCFWTSRPITWTWPRSNGWKASFPGFGPPSS